MTDSESKGSLGWWIAAILTPIGLLGSPIEIAQIFSNMIEWKGPIAFIVNFWTEAVSLPFHNVLQGLANLVCKYIHLPLIEIPKWLSSYIALSAILATCTFRASKLVYPLVNVHWSYFPAILFQLLLWPFTLITFVLMATTLPFYKAKDTPEQQKLLEMRGNMLLTLALILTPFSIFVCLMTVNHFWGQ